MSQDQVVIKSFHLQIKTDSQAFYTAILWFDNLYNPAIPRRPWLEFQTAFGEALDNAIKHAHFGLSSDTPIDLAVTIFHHSLQLEIWDHGPEFDLEQQINLLPEQLDLMAEHGRGLLILKRVADFLSYRRIDDRRNRLHLLKHFDSLG